MHPISRLKKLFRKSQKVFVKKPTEKVRLFQKRQGKKHKCNICRKTFRSFVKYHGGNRKIPEFRRRLNLVDSDRDNFGCPYCPSYDRERHLFLFFDKIGFWGKISHSAVLHFAPEFNLSKEIESLAPLKYIKCDFAPPNEDVIKVDATNIPYEDNSFDIIICNHVLEHIPHYLRALQEIYRVLKTDGIAILQTPYSKVLKKNFEDENINTDDQRLFFYGEKDHFRIFGEENFFSDIKSVGFHLNVIKHKELFDEQTSLYYGVSSEEDLIQVKK